MTDPISEPSAFARQRRQRPPRLPLLPVAVLLLIAALVFGAYQLFRGPRLVFTNRLAGTVRLAAEADSPRLVSAGSSVELTLPRGRSLVAMWELVRPRSADGRPMGEEVRGTIVVPDPRGLVHRAATPRGSHGDYFAPLVSNASEEILRVSVNQGLEGKVDCGCAVRAGSNRVFIGYYRLFQNTTVQARTLDGRAAMFRDLGPHVVAGNGTIGLRFETKDLRSAD